MMSFRILRERGAQEDQDPARGHARARYATPATTRRCGTCRAQAQSSARREGARQVRELADRRGERGARAGDLPACQRAASTRSESPTRPDGGSTASVIDPHQPHLSRWRRRTDGTWRKGHAVPIIDRALRPVQEGPDARDGRPPARVKPQRPPRGRRLRPPPRRRRGAPDSSTLRAEDRANRRRFTWFCPASSAGDPESPGGSVGGELGEAASHRADHPPRRSTHTG